MQSRLRPGLLGVVVLGVAAPLLLAAVATGLSLLSDGPLAALVGVFVVGSLLAAAGVVALLAVATWTAIAAARAVGDAASRYRHARLYPWLQAREAESPAAAKLELSGLAAPSGDDPDVAIEALRERYVGDEIDEREFERAVEALLSR